MKKDVKVEFLKAKNLDTCIELIKKKENLIYFQNMLIFMIEEHTLR